MGDSIGEAFASSEQYGGLARLRTPIEWTKYVDPIHTERATSFTE